MRPRHRDDTISSLVPEIHRHPDGRQARPWSPCRDRPIPADGVHPLQWRMASRLLSAARRAADAERLAVVPKLERASTTLAGMVDHVNNNLYGHVLTIEDPIEFVHEPRKCVINQREVGPHTLSFSNALRSALREDPDVVLVGELRDLETIRLALTAAETGHLVFGTLHTSSAAKTIDRIVDVFPAAEKEMVRAMVSESLIAVISQAHSRCSERSAWSRNLSARSIASGTVQPITFKSWRLPPEAPSDAVR